MAIHSGQVYLAFLQDLVQGTWDGVLKWEDTSPNGNHIYTYRLVGSDPELTYKHTSGGSDGSASHLKFGSGTYTKIYIGPNSGVYHDSLKDAIQSHGNVASMKSIASAYPDLFKNLSTLLPSAVVGTGTPDESGGVDSV